VPEKHHYTVLCPFCSSSRLRHQGILTSMEGYSRPMFSCNGCNEDMRLEIEQCNGEIHLWMRRTEAAENKFMQYLQDEEDDQAFIDSNAGR